MTRCTAVSKFCASTMSATFLIMNTVVGLSPLSPWSDLENQLTAWRRLQLNTLMSIYLSRANNGVAPNEGGCLCRQLGNFAGETRPLIFSHPSEHLAAHTRCGHIIWHEKTFRSRMRLYRTSETITAHYAAATRRACAACHPVAFDVQQSLDLLSPTQPLFNLYLDTSAYAKRPLSACTSLLEF